MSIISHHTISLDGYIAGREDSMDWAFAHGRPTSLAGQTIDRLGAILAGRRWYELAEARWDGVDGIYGGGFEGTVFVLTHDPPGGEAHPRVRFLADGIHAAVARAQAAAGEQDVGVFGASLTRQCLRAGLLDELVLHLVPVLLGGGVRLFGEGESEPIKLERLSVGQGRQLTDLRFRVVKRPGRDSA